jgi:hypothetical protein
VNPNNSLRESPTFRRVVAAVAESFRIEPEVLLGRLRTQRVCDARNLVVHLLRRRPIASHGKIAAAFGRSDQNWSIWCWKAAHSILSTEEWYRLKSNAIEAELGLLVAPLTTVARVA